MMNKEEFIQLLQDKKYKTAQHTLSEMNDMDTAAFLEELDAKECALAFRLISKEKAADVFSCMNSKMQTFLVDMFSETELKELLDDLYMDDTVDMLEDLPANLVTRILKNLDSTKRSTISTTYDLLLAHFRLLEALGVLSEVLEDKKENVWSENKIQGDVEKILDSSRELVYSYSTLQNEESSNKEKPKFEYLDEEKN